MQIVTTRIKGMVLVKTLTLDTSPAKTFISYLVEDSSGLEALTLDPGVWRGVVGRYGREVNGCTNYIHPQLASSLSCERSIFPFDRPWSSVG